MSVGEFTVSNIAADEDKKETEKAKQTRADMDKLQAEIDVQKQSAKEVSAGCAP